MKIEIDLGESEYRAIAEALERWRNYQERMDNVLSSSSTGLEDVREAMMDMDAAAEDIARAVDAFDRRLPVW